MPFALGVSFVPVAEAALISTIVRLSSQLAGVWELSKESTCDVSFVDITRTDAPRAQEGTGTQILVKIVPAGSAKSGDAHVLERPIRAERLIALLVTLEAELNSRAASGKVAAQATHHAIDGRMAKLTRWPCGAMTFSDINDLRVMTKLTARAYTAPELAAATGRSLDAVNELLSKLDTAGFITWTALAPAPTASGSAPIPRGSTTFTLRKPSPLSRGLIGQIRSRLGFS